MFYISFIYKTFKEIIIKLLKELLYIYNYNMNDTLNFYELFDKTKLQYIIDNYDDIKDNLRPLSTDRLNNINIDPLNLVKKYLYKSKSTKIPNINIINVFYKQIKNKGRNFAIGSLSLQNIPREIRHTIAGDLYLDIDIKNAHPELICQYAQKHDLSCKYIKKYIDHRQAIFEEFSKNYKTTDCAIKNAFLCILNGAKTFLGMKDDEMPSIVRKYK
jgi:hypothetical protein